MILWILLLTPAGALTRFVNPTGVDSGDCTDNAAPCQSIIYTIDQAIDGDTIDLAAGIYTEGSIAVGKDLLFQGNEDGITIVQANESMGGGLRRVFFIDSGVTVAMENITIRHGKTADAMNPSPGGGIFNAGDLALMNCRVNENSTGNGSGGPGGGLFNGETGILTIVNTTISGNTTGGGSSLSQDMLGTGGNGGGIFNAGTVFITNSTISNNATGSGFFGNPKGTLGGSGGGIFNSESGDVTLTNSTISGNATGFGGSFANGGDGGGIFNEGNLSLIHTTISNNETGIGGISGQAGAGGGIFNSSGIITSTHTLIANNITPGNGEGADCFGSLDSNGFNLLQSTDECNLTELTHPGTDIFGVDPMLNRLGENGGLTSTHSLLLGSTAIDQGDPDFSLLPVFDQRGQPRVIGGRIDIGAFEFAVPPRFNLALEKGWNLISIPLTTSESTTQIFGDSIRRKVWKWNALQQRFDEATTLEPGFAYWLYNDQDSQDPISIVGSGIGPADIQLEPQWNLIGPSKMPPFDEIPIETTVLNPLDSVSGPIWTWDGSQFKMATFLELGRGYWVFSE